MEVEQQNVPVEISCVDMEYAPQDSGCGQQLLIFAETNSLIRCTSLYCLRSEAIIM